jgi:hypothetical protein
MKNIISLFGIAIIILSIYSCKSSPTEPVLDFNNITWKADTLAYPGSYQTNMYSIWGTSSENLYVCGHNERGYGQVWHYNGSKWTDIDIAKDIPNKSGDYQKMFGFSADKIWLVGEHAFMGTEKPARSYGNPLIVRYNGTKWTVDHLGADTAMIVDIHGTSYDNLWACGSNGVLYKYSSGSWKTMQIFKDIKEQKKLNFASVKTNGTDVYLFANKQLNSFIDFYEYFIILNNDKISRIDSFRITSENQNYKWGFTGFLSSKNKLYSRGLGLLFEWDGNKWTRIYEGDNSCWGIKEINGSIIAVGSPSAITYNNSGNWEKITTPYYDVNTLYTDAWSDGKKIFIVGIILNGYPQRTIILKGE